MNIPLKCLIVEDDSTMIYIIKIELSNYGFDATVTHVENADQMKTAMKEREFDIIISDHNMPSFSSLEALNIRNEISKKTPFLIYTNYVENGIRMAAIKNGCDEILNKEDVLLLPKLIEKLTCKKINQNKNEWGIRNG